MNKWAVITGGGGGIGAALSIILAEKALQVLVIDLNIDPLEKLRSSCKASDWIHLVQGDLTKDETINKISSHIPKEDEIRFVVSCQRVGHIGKLEDLKISDFENAMKVHVISPLMVYQKILPRLKAANGRILHTDTLVDYYPQYGCGAYGVSKTAYHKLGQQLRLELADTDVCVGSAYPGLVNSEGCQADIKSLKDAKLLTAQGIELQERNKRDGTFLEPNESAKFLSFVLLETSDEEFERINWRADDKSQWYRWNK